MSETPEELKKLLSAFFLWINEMPDDLKYTFKFEEGKIHYTIRIWSKKREIDLHRTDENLPQGNPERYKTIFRISFFSIGRILVSLKQIDFESFGRSLLKSKIKVGKLKKYNCILVPLDQKHPIYEQFLITKRKKSGKKYRLNTEVDLAGAMQWIMPEDALDHPVRCFMVYRYKRGHLSMNGTVYRFPGAKVHGDRSFIYFSHKMNKDLRKTWGLIIYNTLSKINFYNKEEILGTFRKFLPLQRDIQ